LRMNSVGEDAIMCHPSLRTFLLPMSPIAQGIVKAKFSRLHNGQEAKPDQCARKALHREEVATTLQGREEAYSKNGNSNLGSDQGSHGRYDEDKALGGRAANDVVPADSEPNEIGARVEKVYLYCWSEGAL
jgi:hypothetical protein